MGNLEVIEILNRMIDETRSIKIQTDLEKIKMKSKTMN